jgi:GNAT superfamily N-acetyltransferase
VNVQIRRATEGDLPALADIFQRASLSNPGDRDALLAHPEALEFAGEGVGQGRTRVALGDMGTVVGFATTVTTANALELEDLFVHPLAQRHGVGRRLIEDAAAISRARGLEGIDVTANPEAGAFYDAMGFVGGETVETQFGPGCRMRLATPEPARPVGWSAEGADPPTLEL